MLCNEAIELLEDLVRTLTLDRVEGCFLAPSALHGIALLSKGYFTPQLVTGTKNRDTMRKADFYFMVNDTLLKMGK